MTCITLALLGKVDDKLKKRLEDSKTLRDYFIGKAKTNFLLATTETKVGFEGVQALQMEFDERQTEDLIALIAERDVDYSLPVFRIYADPFNTPSLAADNRVGDGFIIKADRPYDSPEGNLKLLRAINSGSKVTATHRRSGEPTAIMNNRILLARCGPHHPKDEEILRPFTTTSRKFIKIHVLAFNVKNGKITVDNTYKPKTVKIPPHPTY